MNSLFERMTIKMKRRISDSIYTYLLLSAVALTGCTRETLPESSKVSDKGLTYMNVVVDNRYTLTSRADELTLGEQRDYAINQMLLFMQEGTNTEWKTFTPFNLTRESPYRPKEAWEVDPSKRYQLAIFANISATGSDFLYDEVGIDFTNGNVNNQELILQTADMNDFVTNNSVAMISLKRSGNVEHTLYPGVTKRQAERATANVYYNNIPISLERIVAKAAVQVPRRKMEIRTAAGERLGDFVFQYFGVTQVPDQFYLVPKFENDKPVSAPTDTYYPIGVFMPDRRYNGLGYVKYVDDFDASQNYTYGNPDSGFNPLGPVLPNVGAQPYNSLRGVYMPENIQGDENRTAQRILTWGKVTHFKIYGKVIPAADRFGDGQTYNGGTFYFNKEDRKFYTSIEGKTGDFYMFPEGRGFYRALVNCVPADADYSIYSNPVTNADVRRNRFYVLEVTELFDLPSNWDSMNPNPGTGFPSNNENDANTMFIKKVTAGNVTRPYDGIMADTPVNNTRQTLRITTRVAHWHSQLFEGSIGSGN